MNLPDQSSPLVVMIAGPNGAGKTTFYRSHLSVLGLRFVNADSLAAELSAGPYAAARVADEIRRELIRQRESFVFETVFSDPVGEKLAFMKYAEQEGFAVVVCFIGIESAELSDRRVAMRVTRKGHDVPRDKLIARFPRTLVNLAAAMRELSDVRVYDNTDLRTPFREVGRFSKGEVVKLNRPVPKWLRRLLP